MFLICVSCLAFCVFEPYAVHTCFHFHYILSQFSSYFFYKYLFHFPNISKKVEFTQYYDVRGISRFTSIFTFLLLYLIVYFCHVVCINFVDVSKYRPLYFVYYILNRPVLYIVVQKCHPIISSITQSKMNQFE